MSQRDEQRLFATRHFSDFGPSALSPAAGTAPLQRIEGEKTAVLRSRLRQHCPAKPGVYGMLDRHGELLYVGKSSKLRLRLFSYLRPRSRDERARRLMKHVGAIVWETASSEFAALHRELELIRRWRPRFNVHGQPQSQRRVYLALGRQPAQYAFLTARLPRAVLAFYGPLPAGRQAQEAVRRLNDWFQLRDCAQSQAMHFADQGELFPVPHTPGCLRLELGTCLGPCAAACTREQYGAQVQSARDFLDGRDLAVLGHLHRGIKQATTELAFERAAGLRDKLTALVWLHEHLQRLRQIKAAGSFIYPLLDEMGEGFWYLIQEGRTVGVRAVPRALAARQQILREAQARFQTPLAPTDKEPFGYLENVYLLASWFKRHPQEWEKRFAPEGVEDTHSDR